MALIFNVMVLVVWIVVIAFGVREVAIFDFYG